MMAIGLSNVGAMLPLVVEKCCWSEAVRLDARARGDSGAELMVRVESLEATVLAAGAKIIYVNDGRDNEMEQ